MNYPYPIPGSTGVQNSFVAGNTGVLGDLDQSADARTLVSVDYSQLVPAVTLLSVSFRMRPGGEPQLMIDTVTLSTASMTFFVKGGIEGVQYQLTLVAALGGNEVRTDVLNVNVQGDACGCNSRVTSPPPTNGAVSGDGSLIVNTAPRFFISGTPPVGAHVLDRWYNTASGEILDFISTGNTQEWVLSSAGGGGGSMAIRDILPVHPDGSTTTFILTAVDGTVVNIAGASYLFVSLDGVWQNSTTQYTATGNSITFNQAPTADAAIFMLWFGPNIGTGA